LPAVRKAIAVRETAGDRQLTATLALLIASLTPAPAQALPGPEILVPLTAGVMQALAGIVWIARRLQRRTRRTLLRIAVLLGVGALSWMLIGWRLALIAAAAAGLLASRSWRERGFFLLLGGLGLAMAGPSNLLTGSTIPPVPPAFDPARPPLGPFPEAKLAVLRSGPAHVIQLGEREDFNNCSLPGASLLRPADLAVAAPRLHALDAPVVLLVGPTTPPPDAIARAQRLGFSHVAPFREAFPVPGPPIVCYTPGSAQLVRQLIPEPLLALAAVGPGAPLDLDRGAWLRPRDMAHLAASSEDLSVRQAAAILSLSSTALTELRDRRIALVGEDVHSLAAAARLLDAAGAEVVAITRGSILPARIGHQLSAPALIAALIAVALLAALLGLLGRLGAWRAEAAHARGNGRRWRSGALRAAAELATLLGSAAAAWLVGRLAVPPALALLVTPTMVSTAALVLGGIWFLLLLAGLWLRAVRLPAGWRLGWALLAIAVGIGAVPGLVLGIAIAPLHVLVLAAGLLGGALLESGLLAWWRRRSRRRAGRRPGWALLEHTAGLSAAGGKASRLGAVRRAEGAVVPPGLVLWPGRGGRATTAALRAVRRLLGPGPYLARSSAAAEDGAQATAAGRFDSRIARDGASLPDAVAAVAAGYSAGAAMLPPVLIMPLVACSRAGVAQAPPAGGCAVLVEHGPQRDAVTAGRAGERASWGRISQSWLQAEPPSAELLALGEFLARRKSDGARYLEWLARGRALWLVQDRPAPAAAELAAGADIAALAALVEPPRDVDAPWLRSVAIEGLPLPAAASSLELWAGCWRRDRALGRALRRLRIPPTLVAHQPVVAAWGSLWAFAREADGLARLVQLRLSLAAAVRRRSLDEVAGRLARRMAAEPRDLEDTQARSIALRLLEPFLAEQTDRPPPAAPSLRLAAALRECADPQALGAAFAHRARYDLDPATVRYGELARTDWRPPDTPPRWPAAAAPAVLDRRWCDFYRDLLHDRLAWETARLRARSPELAAAHAEPGSRPTANSLSLRQAESVGLPPATTATSGRGSWVSGSGPIAGQAESDPGRPHPERILVLTTPTPEAAARFGDFRAVVAASGGALSHAALVARELGVPALFGVGEQALADRGRIRLTADGRVEPEAHPPDARTSAKAT
jgi:phosphohistidine swiveling domain-containing protein